MKLYVQALTWLQSAKIGVLLTLSMCAISLSAQVAQSSTSESVTAEQQAQQSGARARAKAAMQSAERDLVERHSPESALANFRRAIELDPSFPAPRFNLGVLAEAQEDWDGAIEWFQQYLILDADSKWAMRARDEIERARRIKAIDIANSGPQKRRYDAYIELGRRMLTGGKTVDAVIEARRAAAVDDKRWEAFALAAAASSQAQKWDDAEKYLLGAINRSDKVTSAELITTRNLILPATSIGVGMVITRANVTRYLNEVSIQARLGADVDDSFPGLKLDIVNTDTSGIQRSFVVTGPSLNGISSELSHGPGLFKLVNIIIPVPTDQRKTVMKTVTQIAKDRLIGWAHLDKYGAQLFDSGNVSINIRIWGSGIEIVTLRAK